MKQFSVAFFYFFSLILFAQNSEVTSYFSFKTKDDIAGYIYATIDEFSKNPSSENLHFFTELEQRLWRLPSSKTEKIAWLHCQIQQAYHLKQLGQLSVSLQVYEKAFHYYTTQHLSRYNILEYCLLPMANNYTRLGAFDRAETLLKVAESIASKQVNSKKLAAVYNNLSIVYQSQGFYTKAANLLEKTLELKELTTSQKARVLGNLAIVLVRLNKLELAIEQAKKSLLLAPNNLELAQKLASIKAQYFEKERQFEAAISEYKKALLLAGKLFGTDSREYIKSSLNLAAFYSKQNQLEKGLTLYNDCLKKQNNQFQTIDNTLKTIYEGMGDIAYQKGEISTAINYYKQGLEANQHLKEALVADISKIRLLVESNILSEKIIAAYYVLYQTSKDENYALSALNISEHSKASIVTDQLRRQSVKKLHSNTIFNREVALKTRQSQLLHQRMLEEQNQEFADISKLKNINNELNILTNNLLLLTQKIQETYPELHYKSEEIKKQDLLQLLQKEQQLLIEYFVGSDAVYVFSFAKNSPVSFRKIKNKALLQEQLRLFYELFADSGGRKIHNNIQNYNNQAHHLYQLLLQPELQNHRYSSLLIIPDAAIGLIPFDALHTSSTTRIDFSKMPYLLHQTEIIYNASIQIMRMHKTQPNPKKFTGFFPIFDTDNSIHSPLLNTLTEAQNIHKTINGTVFLRKEASKENFLKQQKNTGILHIATHASSGTNRVPPSIEFSDKTLFLTELYGMQFMSQLIVLSACETNVGPIYKGEGILSLARGFLYAGIQNSIVSQWEVNDKSTEYLMSNFYKKIIETSQVSTALRLSKLSYISNKKIHHLKKSPYYWAGFSYMGQLQNPPKKTKLLWLIPISFAFLLTGYYYYRRKQ